MRGRRAGESPQLPGQLGLCVGWGWGSVTRPVCKCHCPSLLLTQLIFPPCLLRHPICCSGGERGRTQPKAAGEGCVVPTWRCGPRDIRGPMSQSQLRLFPDVASLYPIGSGAHCEGGPGPPVPLQAQLVPSVPSAAQEAPGQQARLSPCVQQSPGSHGDPLGLRAAAPRSVWGQALPTQTPGGAQRPGGAGGRQRGAGFCQWRPRPDPRGPWKGHLARGRLA